jgi:hypothetical protein
MDKPKLIQILAEAEQHIAAGERHFEGPRKIICELARHGNDVTIAISRQT